MPRWRSTPNVNFTSTPAERRPGQVGYESSTIDDLPEAVIASFAGVANPFYFGLPKPGETVLDVGSGGGVDAIIAARAVGPEGRVIGVDMTPEMLDAARRNSDRMGFTNISSFGKGWSNGYLLTPNRWIWSSPTASSISRWTSTALTGRSSASSSQVDASRSPTSAWTNRSLMKRRGTSTSGLAELLVPCRVQGGRRSSLQSGSSTSNSDHVSIPMPELAAKRTHGHSEPGATHSELTSPPDRRKPKEGCSVAAVTIEPLTIPNGLPI
jgi:Methyltransferase domain